MKRDRYDVAGNAEAQYVDAAGAVLVNQLGITELALLQRAEEDAPFEKEMPGRSNS